MTLAPTSDQLSDDPRPAAVGWLRLLAIGALGVLLLASWSRVVSIAIAMGPHRTIRLWAFATVVSFAALVALAVWQARSRSARLSLRSLVALMLLWSIAGAAAWYAMAAPLARNVGMAVLFPVATWWLLWCWAMWLVRWSAAARAVALVMLLAVAGVFPLLVRGASMDGQGRPTHAWRFGATQLAATESDPADEVETSTSAALGPADTVSQYPRYRGADGTATIVGAHLARDWEKRAPVLRWRRAVGPAWSTFAVAGGDAITQEQQGEEEWVACYDRNTGRRKWIHRDQAHHEAPNTGDGPRATPTILETRVLALGATGILSCLDRATGEKVWGTNIAVDAGAEVPMHGSTGSPLVVGDKVIVSAGGPRGASLVAYDLVTGKRVWAGGSDGAGYASPQWIELAGMPQIVIVNVATVCGHDPQTGAVLWSVPWVNDQRTNCSQAAVIGSNRVFVSCNYGKGSSLVEVAHEADVWKAEPLWASRALQTKFCSAVVRDGFAYAMDDGILECVALADGRRRWKRGRYGHGQLMLVDDLLLIQGEDGRVVLVEASPDDHHELAAFDALNGKTWNNPALAGRQLFVRNDREACCYELPVEE